MTSAEAHTVFQKPTGPYAVGTQTRHWIDPQRPEQLTQYPSDVRELLIQFWYPAQSDPKGKKADYHSDPKVITKDAVAVFHLPAFIARRLTTSTTNSLLNSKVSDNQPQYPVVIFSPGLNGSRVQNTFQAEELASHGYIVVAIEHAHGSIGCVFPDGRHANTIEFGRIFNEKGFDYFLLDIWRDDIRFVLDELEKVNENDPQEFFTNKLNLSKVGIIGHSLGGAAAAHTMTVDKRFKAGINLDGFLAGKEYKIEFEEPFMQIRSEINTKKGPRKKEEKDPNMEETFIDFTIPKTNHYSFTDLPLVMPFQWLTGNKAEKIHRKINQYTLEFFDRYLK